MDSSKGYIPLDDQSGKQHSASLALLEGRQSQAFEVDLSKNIKDDLKTKRNIRILRIVARLLTVIWSILVLIPVSMAVASFYRTHHIHRFAPAPNGGTELRNPWSIGCKVWPTWVFFAIAVISVIVSTAVLIGYLRSINAANYMDNIYAGVSTVSVIANLVWWVAGVTVIRAERVKNGNPNDIWGWTCSDNAQRLQETFRDQVDYKYLCKIQTLGFYAALVQIGIAIMTVLIYIYALKREQSKSRIQHLRQSFEPHRRATESAFDADTAYGNEGETHGVVR